MLSDKQREEIAQETAPLVPLLWENIQNLPDEGKVYHTERYGIVPGENVTAPLTALQTAISEAGGGIIQWAPGEYYLVDFQLASNVQWRAPKGLVTIKLPPDLPTGSNLQIVEGDDKVGLRFEGIIFDGNRSAYGTGISEHWHCADFRGCDVEIVDCEFNNAIGDGAYFGQGLSGPSRVRGYGWRMNNNRRNGIAVVSVTEFVVDDIVIVGTNGTDLPAGPEAGIDFEPNSTNDRLENIRITNIRTEENRGGGIVVAPRLMVGADSDVDIVIRGHTSVEDRIASFRVGHCTGALGGRVIVQDARWIRPVRAGFVARNWASVGPRVEIRNPFILDPESGQAGSTMYGSVFTIYREDGDGDGSTPAGNIHIFEPELRVTGPTTAPKFLYVHPDAPTPENISLVDPIAVEGMNVTNCVDLRATKCFASDRHQLLVRSTGNASFELREREWVSLINTDGMNTTRTVILSSDIEVGWPDIEVVHTATSGNPMKILPDEESVILPLSSTPGKAIVASTRGSRIRLRKVEADAWMVVWMAGDWQEEITE